MGNEKRVVRDFFNGIKIMGKTIGYPLLFLFLFIGTVAQEISFSDTTGYILMSIIPISLILGIIGFITNYVPLKVVGDTVSIPAADRIRTFADLITINPITGLYRRREYNVNDIENVAKGYTKIKRGKEREWNVVISGIKNGKSFSQRIDCSNKQARDEIRNVLKQTIKGRVNSDFAV